MNRRLLIADSYRQTRARPARQSYGTLPPFDARVDPSDPTLQLHMTLPAGFTLPPSAMRGNFWGQAIPGGLPFVPNGTSSVHPERCLDWFIDEYVARDPGSFDRILTAKAEHGLNTFLLSRGGGFGRQSPSDQAAQAAYIRSWGFDILYMLTSKDIDPWPIQNQGYVMWKAVRPYLDVLGPLVQRVALAWEASFFWDPVALDRFGNLVLGYFRGSGVRVGCHFPVYLTAWQLPGHSRADFWTTGLLDCYYQTHPSAPLRTNQAHLNDAMVPASGLQANGVTLHLMEVDAAAQFDGEKDGWISDEAIGDMRAYGLLCTPGPIAVGGLGNGGHRRPDGSYL